MDDTVPPADAPKSTDALSGTAGAGGGAAVDKGSVDAGASAASAQLANALRLLEPGLQVRAGMGGPRHSRTRARRCNQQRGA